MSKIVDQDNVVDFTNYLNEQMLKVSLKKIKGIMVYHKKKPIGFAILELPSKNYGCLVLCAIEDKYYKPLAEQLMKADIMNKSLVEIVHFCKTEAIFYDVFEQKGYDEAERFRMKLDLSNKFNKLENEVITFEEWQPDYFPMTGEISFRAHQASRDQVCYESLSSVALRVQLEYQLFHEKKGKLILPACNIVKYKGRVTGACTVVETKAWQYEKVPWIFDIFINPDMHGLGIGKLLLWYTLYKLETLKYKIVGLAVTRSNKNALKIYEKFGFVVQTQFVEFGKAYY